jgi:hypothetical protein
MVFSNVRWGVPTAPLGWSRDADVFDENLLRPKEAYDRHETSRLEPTHVADIYKGLRLSYESSHHYAEAGRFHIREMEMRRLEAKGWRRWGSVLAIYGLTSKYGERYWRAAGWLAGWLLAFVALQWALRPVRLPEPLHMANLFLNQAVALIPGQIGGSTFLQFVGRLGAAFLIASIVIALRRNLRR